MVSLVGAGPGDPGLLTVKGMKALRSADVILYDRLVGDEITALLPEAAEKINVGKNSGRHLIPQNEINAILLEKARSGLNVVRLKGGDPFVFGRGGEELVFLAENGIEFEVIPGVSASIAGPAYAGIPVTHRDYASSVHIITGHAKENGRVGIDFKALAALEGTLVFMMSVSTLKEICEGLENAGMDSGVPAAIVENAASPEQRKFIGNIGTLPEIAIRNKIETPSVVVVGSVCRLSDTLDWFSKRPLFGKNVIVTRARAKASVLASRLRSLGCGVLETPCIRTAELPESAARLERALEGLENYQWLVFTSAVGADMFFKRLREARFDIRRLCGVRLAAVGPETRNAIEGGGVYVDYVPDEYNGRALAEGLSARTAKNGGVLIVGARKGAEEIRGVFEERDINYESISVYDTFYDNPQTSKAKEMLINGGIDYVTFTSSSTVEGFVRAFKDIKLENVSGLCIGERTAKAASKYGIKTYVSDEATIDSMVGKLKELTQKDEQASEKVKGK